MRQPPYLKQPKCEERERDCERIICIGVGEENSRSAKAEHRAKIDDYAHWRRLLVCGGHVLGARVLISLRLIVEAVEDCEKMENILHVYKRYLRLLRRVMLHIFSAGKQTNSQYIFCIFRRQTCQKIDSFYSKTLDD